MTSHRRTQALVGLVIALVVPLIVVFFHVASLLGLGVVGKELLWWGLAGVLIVYVQSVERRPLASIGVRALTIRMFWSAIAVAAVIVIADLVTASVMAKYAGSAPRNLMHLTLPWGLLVVLRAAVVEETLFRGYGIERLLELTGNRWIAGGVTLAAFAIAHFAGAREWFGVLVGLTGGLGLTLLYFWRRNLIAVMIVHAVIDAVPLLLPAAFAR